MKDNANIINGQILAMDTNIKNVIGKIGKKIVEEAKRVVPVRTGSLRDSITSTQTKDGVIIEANTDYAEYIEDGTDKMSAQPFMEVAIDATEYKADEMIDDAIIKGFNG